MKTPKTYRLSPRTIRSLEQLQDMLPDWSETDIVEAAIDTYLHVEMERDHCE